MIRTLLPILLLVLFLFHGTAEAQNSLRIAAVVNEEVISVFDLNERLSLVVKSSKAADNPEIRKRLAPQVLRSLIDEKLKLQEAKRLNVSVKKREIDLSLARMEKMNNLPKGGIDEFLRKNGISKPALIKQIEADVAWAKVANYAFRSTIQVSDEEVDEKLAEIKANEGQPELLVGEVFLAVDAPENESEVRALSERLIQQLKSGTSFPALAQNFSQSATSAVGGDLGWIKQGQLGGKLDDALSKIEPGQITPPIRTLDGYYILLLRDRRASPKLMKAGETTVSLQQLFITLPPNPTPQEVSGQMQLAATMREMATSCPEMENLGKELNTPMSGNLGKVKTSNLPANLKQVVQSLPDGKPSNPIRTKQGIIIIMVCEREGGSAPTGDERKKVKQMLEDARMDLAAQRYLRDLRRSAFVDLRI